MGDLVFLGAWELGSGNGDFGGISALAALPGGRFVGVSDAGTLIGFGLMWGVVGMVLAIPITGMLKIVCDSIPSLKPWGYILGEDIDYPDEQQIHLPFINPKKVKVPLIVPPSEGTGK